MSTTSRLTNLASAIPGPAAPLARTLYYKSRITGARLLANIPPTAATAASDTAPIFILGCGRSGTSILGEAFSVHPQVKYFYEPYALWAAVSPVTDFLQLYTRGEHHCLLDSCSATSEAKIRFQRLMTPLNGLTLVEKTPINTLRIGFLDALAPGARYLHIVRDGVRVARSIERIASASRRMAFRPPLNNWWGVGNRKWSALAEDGLAAGYYPNEVSLLSTDAQRGAYEWLVSMREIDSWRAVLGPRLIELRLDDLVAEPRKSLEYIGGALGLGASRRWLDIAAAKVRAVPDSYGLEIPLPGQMMAEFNMFQEILGFAGRAVA